MDWDVVEEKHNSPLNCTFLHCISKNKVCKPLCNKFLTMKSKT